MMEGQQRTGLFYNNYRTTQSPSHLLPPPGTMLHPPSLPLLPQPPPPPLPPPPMPIGNPSKVNYTSTRKWRYNAASRIKKALSKLKFGEKCKKVVRNQVLNAENVRLHNKCTYHMIFLLLGICVVYGWLLLLFQSINTSILFLLM